jgi:hypothetical protein
MQLETINVGTLPFVFRETALAYQSRLPEADSSKFTGHEAYSLHDRTRNLLRTLGIPIQGREVVDMTQYFPGVFKYYAPRLVGEDDANFTTSISLSSADLSHPLYLGPVGRADDPSRVDLAIERIARFDPQRFHESTKTFFHFYYDHFDRLDLTFGATDEVVANNRVISGDQQRLTEVLNYMINRFSEHSTNLKYATASRAFNRALAIIANYSPIPTSSDHR